MSVVIIIRMLQADSVCSSSSLVTRATGGCGVVMVPDRLTSKAEVVVKKLGRPRTADVIVSIYDAERDSD